MVENRIYVLILRGVFYTDKDDYDTWYCTTVPTVEEHCMNMYEMCVCVCLNVVRHTHLISNVVTHKKVRAESHRRHKDLFRQVFSSVSSSIVL